MPQVDMLVIPEPEPGTRSIVKEGPELHGPIMRGKGQTTFRCGRCKRVLLEDIGSEQIQGLVFQCPECSSFLELPTTTQS